MKRLTYTAFVTVVFLSGCSSSRKLDATASNRPVLDAFVSAWNRHDSAAFDTLLTTNAVYEDPALNFRGVGSAQLKAFMTEVIKMEPDFRWNVTNVVENGPKLAAEWTWTSSYTGDTPSGPAKQLRISGIGASVAEVEGGRIKKFTDYYDAASYFPKASTNTTATR